MSYILNKTDGTALVTVLDNTTTGNIYSVAFIGKNYLSYGEALNESLLHLLENSASLTVDRPVNPVTGQTWYNKTDKTLYVCYQERVGATPAQFRALAKSNISNSAPVDPTVGDLWFDPTTGLLKVYSGSAWTVVGPTPQPDWAQTDGAKLDFIKNKPVSFTPNLTVKNNGTDLSNKSISINFTGVGVTASLVSGTTNNIEVNIPGTGALSALSDVTLTSPSSGQVLKYNGTKWINGVDNAGVSGVILPTDATGYLYNSGNGTLSWGTVTTSSAMANLTDVDTTGVAVGNVLKYTNVSGVNKWRPVATSTAAASTSFTLATTDGSAKSMGVVLTPGTWQVILDTRLTTQSDYNHDATLTQTATVGSVTVITSIRTNRGGGAGHGRGFLGATDIAVGEFTLAVDTAVVMNMQAAVPGDVGMQLPIGSTLTVSKIASTDAQNLYSGSMPTFTVPSASGIGVGQSWQNVIAYRATDTSYQNSTGAPIMVVVTPQSYNIINLFASTDNANWINIGMGSAFASSDNSIGGIIPNSHYYKVTGGFRIWAELR